MSVIFAAVSFLVLLAILGFIAILTVRAASKIASHHKYKKDDDLKSAHTALTWAAIISWLAIAGIVLVIILAIVGAILTFGEELILLASTAGLFIYGFMAITGLLVFVCGIFTVKAAIDIKKSSNFSDKGDIGTAYHDCIYASVAAFVSLAIILIVVYFLYYYRKHAKKAKVVYKDISEAKRKRKERTSNATQNKKSGIAGIANISQISQLAAENPELVTALKTALV